MSGTETSFDLTSFDYRNLFDDKQHAAVCFSPLAFFDLASFTYGDLFDGVQAVWQVLSRLEEHILIEEDAVVEPGAYIQGPCIIGRGAVVRHGAYVRPGTLAGAESLIGHCTETKNCLLLPHSKAPHFAYVGDSILGNRVNLGAGVKLADLRLDNRTITIKVNGQRYSTGLHKMGAIIGDDSHLGCNAVCNPGTILGPRCVIHALTSVRGYHPAGTVLKQEHAL
jgi:NDP-sugar pyrophosphorylase family protein